MRLSRKSETGAVQAYFHSGHAPLIELYEKVCSNVELARNKQKIATLWSKLSPSGNIYRYLGFHQERLRHCLDLGNQLDVIAEEHKGLLGGKDEPLEKRRSRLIELLKEVVPKKNGQSDLEGNDEKRGFLPLEEFLGDRATTFAGMTVPYDADDFSEWRKNHLTALLVALIQLFAPPLIILHQWFGENNLLLQPRKLYRRLTVQEALCLGAPTAALTTIVGTVMLVMVVTMIINYVGDERENARKQGRLPLDNFWAFFSTLTNASCCLLISIAIPLEFWSEQGPTGIIMNAMAMLFIFTFDDLTGDAFGYLGEDDNSFQRAVSWNYALLAYTPLRIRDLINPNAKIPEELWQISYDAIGRLEVVQQSLHSGQETPTHLCQTRVAPAPETENMKLLKGEDEDAHVVPETHYQVNPKGRVWNLPGKRARIMATIWMTVNFILNVVWWTVPVIYFIVNKPCYDVEDA